MRRSMAVVIASLCLCATASAQDATPPAKVGDLKAVSITGSSVVLGWTAPGDDGNAGTATSYDIRYARSIITATNWNDSTKVTKAEGEPKPRAAGNTEAFEVTGLRSRTLYYIALKSLDEAGNASELSNVIPVTTQEVELSEGVEEKGEVSDQNDAVYYKIKVSSGQHLFVVLDKKSDWFSSFYIRYNALPIRDCSEKGLIEGRIDSTSCLLGGYAVF